MNISVDSRQSHHRIDGLYQLLRPAAHSSIGTRLTTMVTFWKHSGSRCGAFGSSGSTGGIHQFISASPGDQVCVSFWLANLGGPTNSFDATLDGVSIASVSNAAPFG